MLFERVAPVPEGILNNLYPLVTTIENTINIEQQAQNEKEFITALMSQTTDNIRVTLDPDEILYVVINVKHAINITNILTDTTTFNLGGLVKLLKTTQSTFTYFVIMTDDRKGSICIKEIIGGTGCHAMQHKREMSPVTGMRVNLKGTAV